MALVVENILGSLLCYEPSWLDKGFKHGFLANDFDCRAHLPQFAKWFCALSKKSCNQDSKIFLLKQIHCSDFVVVDEGTCETIPNLDAQFESDGWALDLAAGNTPANIFVVQTADCFPVIGFAEKEKKAFILHCGWKGSVSGILPNAIRFLAANGCDVNHLQIAIGPGAQVDDYEIQSDVERELQIAFEKCLLSQEFRGRFSEIVVKKDNKMFGNISALLVSQALSCGVNAENIFQTPISTITDERFFSVRRQGKLAGRQISFIAL